MWETIATKLITEILQECLNENSAQEVIERSQSPRGRRLRRVAARRATRKAGIRFSELNSEDKVKYLDFIRNGISQEESDVLFDKEPIDEDI